MVTLRPDRIGRRPIQSLTDAGHSFNDAEDPRPGRLLSLLAEEEEHRPTAGAREGPLGRVPAQAALQRDVPAAPEPAGATEGLLQVRPRSSSHRFEPKEPLGQMDDHLAPLPRLRRGVAAGTRRRGGDRRHRLLRTQATVA